MAISTILYMMKIRYLSIISNAYQVAIDISNYEDGYQNNVENGSLNSHANLYKHGSASSIAYSYNKQQMVKFPRLRI